jgi:hypothetical protein
MADRIASTAGEVSVLGVDPEHADADWRERVGVVLQESAGVFPVRHLQQALLKPFDPHTVGAGFAWHDLLVLAICGVAGLAIAIRRFSWKPKAR